MQAVILAAGMGKRLKDLTSDQTKCMVKVNGVTLIERLLRQLESYNLSRIVIVVGYKGQKLKDYIATLGVKTPVLFVENPVYDKTNNIYSLSLAKDWLCKEDTLLFESDIIVEDSVIKTLVDDPRETLALVDKYESWMDGTCVKLSENDDILEFVPGKKFVFEDIKSYYKTVNIYKFGRHFSQTHYVPFLTAYCAALGNNEYYEQVLKIITMLDDPEIKAKRLCGELWYEIDDIQDLDIASSIFAANDGERVTAISRRYGGYWRYPKLLDFCYLVNPYYPSQKLTDEIKANFETLLTQYPSGMSVNSLLCAKNFGIPQKYIAVGNGAAELIKSLCSRVRGKAGIIRPTFEEYPNRLDPKNVVAFTPKNFTYGADDIIEFFKDKNLSYLFVINPDNPSGNYIPKADILRLVNWAQGEKIKIVVDESFADFADEEQSTLITAEIIGANPRLIVVKSISKSYGVPGLRLGVLVSGDEELVNFVKKDVGIWNINSFAEFYLQIAEKYKSDYAAGLEKFRAERARFISELKKFKSLKIYPTQANYVMAEIFGGVTAESLTSKLLCGYNIYIKDLSKKISNGKSFVRIAVRRTEENNRLLAALHEIFKGGV